MAFAINYSRGVAALLAIVSTGALFWFGNGLNPWWPLVWFAPLPVLLFALRSSWWRAALVAALALLGGSLNMWHYFHAVLHAPALAWVTTYSRSTGVRGSGAAFPRAATTRGSLERVVGFYRDMGFRRIPAKPHLASWYGRQSFLFAVEFPAFFATCFHHRPVGHEFPAAAFSCRARHWAAFAPQRAEATVSYRRSRIGSIALVLIFGALPLVILMQDAHVKVGLIASDEPANVNVADEGAETERLFREYAGEAEVLQSCAQVIVLPEKLGVIVDPDTNGADSIFQAVANKTKATIVVGLIHVSER